MSALGRRLSDERDVWNAVWKHVDTFLDRISSSADQDKPHATTMCALFPVFNVIENARERSFGFRLDAALAAIPGGLRSDGTLIGSATGATLKGGSGRIPGVEDCEFAVAGYKANDDGTLDDPPWAFMSRSVNLATFRDVKHGDVVLRAPTYDFGDLSGDGMIGIEIGDGGLFPKDARIKAMNGGDKLDDGTPVPAKFTSWSALRKQRIDAKKSSNGGAPALLSQQLIALTFPIDTTLLAAIAGRARDFAAQARYDATTLINSKGTLDDAGISGDITGELESASTALSEQADAFDTAADTITNGGVPSHSVLLQWAAIMSNAEGHIASSGLPAAIDKLDRAAAHTMNDAVENRIGYPDGPLRQLRLLEWTLRFFWEHRTAWMGWRFGMVLRALYLQYMTGFTTSFEHLLHGQRTGIPLPSTTKLGKQILVGATEVPLSNLPNLDSLVAGQIVVVGGDRPTLAPVIDVLTDGKKMPPRRLKVPAIAVSTAAGAGLPGTPGLIAVGTELTDHYRRFDDAELVRGAYRPGLPDDGKPARARDGLVHATIAHRSRLALVLGDQGGNDRPPAPPIARPYPTQARFDLEGPITAGANRLFLKHLPAASGSGTGEQLALAAPGEYLLLHGIDPDGNTWQTAVEVDRVVVATGDEAKTDEAAGATPVPPCCAHDQPVMMVYLRSLYLPSDVTQLDSAFLHRTFAGFGARSIVTRVVLPETIDPDTASDLWVGGTKLTPRRDPELEVACRVFETWLPKEKQ